MNNFLKNNALSLMLLTGVIIGGALGLVFGDGVRFLRPFGQIFLNLIFVLVVPLVFFSIASSITGLQRSHVIGKVLLWSLVVFGGMSVIAGILAYTGTLVWNPFTGMETVTDGTLIAESRPWGDLLVSSLTAPDFLALFSKTRMLPLIIFSALFGLGTAACHAEKVSAFLEEGTKVIVKIVEMIMYVAPIGLGCYFAGLMADLGGQIAGSYLRIFLLFLVLTGIVYFVLQPLYIFLVCGKNGLRAFRQNIVTPSITAIATTSSFACIPINIDAAHRMGADKAVADAVIPLGTNLHKDGSVLAGVLKVLFAMMFLGSFDPSLSNAMMVIGIAILVGVVMGAVPTGGMTGELLICSVLGLDPAFAATLMVISTIVDIPATLINSTGNLTGTVLISRLSGK